MTEKLLNYLTKTKNSFQWSFFYSINAFDINLTAPSFEIIISIKQDEDPTENVFIKYKVISVEKSNEIIEEVWLDNTRKNCHYDYDKKELEKELIPKVVQFFNAISLDNSKHRFEKTYLKEIEQARNDYVDINSFHLKESSKIPKEQVYTLIKQLLKFEIKNNEIENNNLLNIEDVNELSFVDNNAFMHEMIKRETRKERMSFLEILKGQEKEDWVSIVELNCGC
jgi:hypothetical protein